MCSSATGVTRHSLPCTQDRACVVSNYIGPQVSLFKRNTADLEENTSEKKSLVQGVHYHAEGLEMHLRWRVRNQESWTSRSGDPRIQAALLRQAGLYCSGQKIYLATRGTAMMIVKQHNTQPGRRKAQRSSESTEDNGNRTEDTQHGPLNIGVGQENGNKLNKRADRRWWKCCGVSRT